MIGGRGEGIDYNAIEGTRTRARPNQISAYFPKPGMWHCRHAYAPGQGTLIDPQLIFQPRNPASLGV